MAVRSYTAADFAAVCRIYLEAKPDELKFEPGHFEFTPLEQDPVILPAFLESSVLVYDDGEVQGFSATFEGQLRALFVQRSARGQGVGQALLSAVLENTSGDVVLNVAQSNAGGLRFYERNGFTMIGEVTRQYSGIDVRYVQMQFSRSAQAHGAVRKVESPSYSLNDLIAQCDPSAPKPADIVRWNDLKPVGREVW